MSNPLYDSRNPNFGRTGGLRDKLAHLGGDPHFIPPPHDAQSQAKQGVVEGPRRSTTAKADRRRRNMKDGK